MFSTKRKTLVTLLVLTLVLATSFVLGPLSRAAASGQDFTLSVSTTSLTLIRETNDCCKDVTVQVGSVNGFTDNVTLVSDDPYGKTFTAWEDTSDNLLALTNTPVTIAAPGTLILDVTANAKGPTSCSAFVPITITATSGNLKHTATIQLRTVFPGECG